jgi:alginate O-acetyltransferase complex protein AlgI
MLFNSLEFAVFFPIVVAVFFRMSGRSQVGWLLFASCIFYMAFIPAYILILLVTILIDYFAGIYMEKLEGNKRKWLLWVSILSTCSVLFVFKYFSFFTSTFVGVAGIFGFQLSRPAVEIILPIGLSFHTFQSLSYVVEVYRGKQKTEKNFIVYATYVMFFPQLVAGPIERPQNLLHQFHEPHTFDPEQVISGLKRMAWGFFKKVVVADRLALYVNDVYSRPNAYNGLQLTIATVFFAYQIYCDFSGYSDIAIGAARVMGFTLMENFNTPYYSLSTSEFWRRWHISLSTWFRDYVYIPMGGSRVTKGWHIGNILITFVASGLWHGANWTFVFWGFLNGAYLVVGWLTQGLRNRFFAFMGLSEDTMVRKAIMWGTTLALTLMAWIVFRANSLGDAAYVFTHLARGWDFYAISTPQFYRKQFPAAVASILMLEIGQLWNRKTSISSLVGQLDIATRWALYASLVMVVLMFGVFRNTQFIYFQF